MSRHDRLPAAPASRRLQIGGLAFGAVGAAVLLAWLAIGIVHLDDRERVGHVQGAWMALARLTNDGAFYPPMFDGERYGGTRWMPLGVALHAGAARLGGELIGGKALTLTLSAALLVVVAMAVRRQQTPWAVVVALLAALVATQAGLFVTTTIGGDVLPVLLQVGALVAAARGGRRWLVVAAVLAGLAPLAKLTAGWAGLALMTWLAARRRWGDLVIVAAVAAATALAGLLVALAASGGRLLETLVMFAFAGGTGLQGLVRAPHQVLFNLGEFAPGFLALVPLAIITVVLAGGWRQASPVDYAFGWALLALLVAYTDIGTGLNQLLDVLVLLVLVVAQLPGRVAAGWSVGRDRGTEWVTADRIGTLAVGAAVACALAVGVSLTLVPALRTALETVRHGHPLPVVPLADTIEQADDVLSEDPYVAVAHGDVPVILDPFMVRRLDEVDPDQVDHLVARIEGVDFDHVLLLMPLDDAVWWRDYHFGPRVTEAIRANYAFVDTRDGYAVYEPR